MREHPLRERIVGEMHLRRLPPIAAPMTILQLVLLVPPEERAAERVAMLAMPRVPPEAQTVRSRHAEGLAEDGCRYCWERHSEASTLTALIPSGTAEEDGARIDRAWRWLAASPGLLVRAVRLDVVADEAAALALLPSIGFAEEELVSCRFGSARMWSDFRIHEGRLGRLLLAAGDMPPADLGRLVQSLQELGNYRNLALLGLPLVQDEGARLDALERALAALTGEISVVSDDRTLLDALCGLAARAAALRAETGFRMGATFAYAEIVHQRLLALDARPIAGFQSLDQFTERRLRPAIRTCESFVARLEHLSIGVERATSLFRTRVDLAMREQSNAVLRSMERNAARQLRLQHLVEGVSVIAISYYAFSLLDHLAAAAAGMSGVDHELVSAALVPLVFTGVALLLRQRVKAAGLSIPDREDSRPRRCFPAS